MRSGGSKFCFNSHIKDSQSTLVTSSACKQKLPAVFQLIMDVIVVNSAHFPPQSRGHPGVREAEHQFL